jgi:hypothetical protein
MWCWVGKTNINFFFFTHFGVDTQQQILSSLISEMKHAYVYTEPTFPLCIHFMHFM